MKRNTRPGSTAWAARWITAIAVAATLVCGGGEALAAQVSCGDTVTHDTTLHSDLSDCPGDGLVIGADNITLDLNGHTIDGDATPAGGDDPDRGIRLVGHHGVTIQNGTVQEFDRGVRLDGASGNRLRRLVVRRSGGRGIELTDGSDGNEIDANTSSGNGRTGIALVSSDDNVLERNTASGNANTGIAGFTATHNRVENNVIADNGDTGIFWTDGSNDSRIEANVISGNVVTAMEMDFSDRNLVTRNRVARNGDGLVVLGSNDDSVTGNLVTDAIGCPDGCGYGIVVDGGANNVVAANAVARMLEDGIRLDAFEPDTPPASGNTIRGNLVRDAGRDGIAVATQGFGTVSGSVLEGNIAIGAGDDGIDVESAATTLTRNLAVRNGDLGIEAVIGVTDGGRNRAAGNHNPAQCTNVGCS